jgi:tRNA (guanine-N7-)-methyltransferase|tara:strand:+ start:121115 stop:121810 length:696 start_codon:yes stop_codon:yes gene_type:complete
MKDLENIQGSRVYGRRLAKPLKKTSEARLREYFPKYSVSLDGPIDLAGLFDHNPREYWMEIGFGKGEHLVAQAKANPDIGFIGCEPFINGVSGLVDHMVRDSVTNIRFFMDDARLLMDAMLDQSISRAFVLFPDPWPKKRHHKRRIISPGNMVVISRLLKDNAELRIGTDHHDYCRWILARLMENPDYFWEADHPDQWHTRPEDWPPTRYEQKALTVGRKSAYMTFKRRPR